MVNKSKGKKWENAQVLSLIEAYKEEPCLYAVTSPNYHNKHLRSEALKRICATVGTIRPGTTETECSMKFHNLRTQFHIENNKLKNSMKSGVGTEDIYHPTLWYFNDIRYLEEFYTSRKSRNSIEKNSVNVTNKQNNQCVDFTQPLQTEVPEEYMHEEWLEAEFVDDPVIIDPQSSSTELDIINPSTRKEHSVSIDNSSQSSSSTSFPHSPTLSVSSEVSCRTRKRKKKVIETSEIDYTQALETIAESLKAPVLIKSADTLKSNDSCSVDPVDSCFQFLGAMLKTFKNIKLKFEVMNKLIQTVMNSKTEDD
ncbi:uncharacterized protein [Prorops nasuta]|uniref:uncharacterized protein n=1 Tax=Prorops nasuta TaxID=863751 RepID=UPI0034CE40CD